jgi:DNA-binding beta-propeller fold protein YncE
VGTLADLGSAAQALGKSPATPFVVTAHETGGLSLYVESAADGLGVLRESEPILESVHDNELRAPTSVTVDGRNRLLYVTRATRSSSISRFGVRVAAEGDSSRQGMLREPGPRELLYPTSDLAVSGVAVGQDLRDIALDPQDPTRLFVLARGAPQALLFMRLDPTAPLRARVTDVVRVGSGPSKLEYTVLDGHPFLLVSSYDARAIFVIDPNIRKLVAEIRNLSGPYDMAVDPARRLLYVADFRTSVVRVVDLAGLVDKSKPRPGIIATLGALTFKGSLQ